MAGARQQCPRSFDAGGAHRAVHGARDRQRRRLLMSFADALYAAAQPQPIETHPFVIGVRSGDASHEAVRSFAMHIASATESFVRALYAILSVCPSFAVRQSLIGNVLEEEGATSYVPGKGAAFDPKRRHPSMGRGLARAGGVTDAQ